MTISAVLTWCGGLPDASCRLVSSRAQYARVATCAWRVISLQGRHVCLRRDVENHSKPITARSKCCLTTPMATLENNCHRRDQNKKKAIAISMLFRSGDGRGRQQILRAILRWAFKGMRWWQRVLAVDVGDFIAPSGASHERDGVSD